MLAARPGVVLRVIHEVVGYAGRGVERSFDGGRSHGDLAGERCPGAKLA